MTGRNSWQLEEAANHVNNFPAKFKTFPEVLREHGYVTALTGKGWGPGDPGTKDGKPRLLIGESYSDIKVKPWATGMSNEDYAANFDKFLNTAEKGRPWFFWYGAREPHRPYEYGSGQRVANKKISDIESVPAFWPDNEVVRNDMLDYALEVEYADSHLERMIESLEKRGLLENTIIVITSDHGMPFPRCKAQEYDYSNHVPMAIMWPKGITNPGRTVDDMVSFIDFAPTFLELAGIPFDKSGMQSSPGKSLTDIFYSQKAGQVLSLRLRHQKGGANDLPRGFYLTRRAFGASARTRIGGYTPLRTTRPSPEVGPGGLLDGSEYYIVCANFFQPSETRSTIFLSWLVSDGTFDHLPRRSIHSECKEPQDRSAQRPG